MTITSNMICANDKYKNACKGDSGGPLAYFDQTYNYWTLIGVTSFGSPLTLIPYPGAISVFSNLFYFFRVEIINQKFWENLTFTFSI